MVEIFKLLIESSVEEEVAFLQYSIMPAKLTGLILGVSIQINNYGYNSYVFQIKRYLI